MEYSVGSSSIVDLPTQLSRNLLVNGTTAATSTSTITYWGNRQGLTRFTDGTCQRLVLTTCMAFSLNA